MPRKQSPETQVRSLKRELEAVRKSAKEEIAKARRETREWQLAAETWKDAHNTLAESLGKRAT